MNTAQILDWTNNFKEARPEIVEMQNLITRTGFFMMGATQIGFSNQQHLLAWVMGSGAKCLAIKLFYQPGADLYRLEFLKSYSDPSRIVRVDRVYGEEVIRTIERETGFYLRI